MKAFFRKKSNIILTLLLAVLLYFIFIYGKQFVVGKKYAIDFSQLNESEVLSWLEKEKVNYELSYEYSETIAKGYVIYQNPSAEEEITDKLLLRISLGLDPNREVDLPDVSQMSKTEVDRWFLDNGFTNVTYEYVLSDDVAVNEIVSLKPSTVAKRSSRVAILLSAGADPNAKISVPDFTTYKVSEIKEWSANNLINIVYQYAYTDKYEEGVVISQDIQASSEIALGSTINVVLSGGSGITIPNTLVTRSDVEAWVSKNNVEVQYVEVYSDTVTNGNLVYSDPISGSVVASGSSITFYISLGQDPSDQSVLVEQGHRGDTPLQFEIYLKSIGLNGVRQIREFYSTEIEEGLVYSYLYEGEEIKMNTIVPYWVSLGAFSEDSINWDYFVDGAGYTAAITYQEEIVSMNGNFEVDFDNIYSDSYELGQIFDCSSYTSSGTVYMRCKYSLGS